MRVLVAVNIMLILAALLFAALPATDNFNRADGAIGSNWEALYGSSCSISSNAASCSSSAYKWVADTPADDQYSQVKIVSLDSDAYAGPVSRTGAGQTYYTCTQGGSSDPTLYLQRFNNESPTTLTSTARSFSANDVLKISVSGSSTVSITCFVNGASVLSVSDSSASRLTSGPGGISAYRSAVFDDFEVGNISASSPPSARRQIVIQ